MPVLHLLAGPNGAGKSSYVRDVLEVITRLPIVNADEIAAALWPDPAVHAYEASRIAEAERRSKIAARESFISETVFSHPSKIELVADAVKAGYLVHLHVMLVPIELSVQRVRERERRGGHAVPEDKVRERHERLWDHLAAAIRIADVTEVFDNSRATEPFRRCATFRWGTLVGEPSWPDWVPRALTAI